MNRAFRWASISTSLVLLFGCGPQSASDSGAAKTEVRRLVAIGDIHADLDAARHAFRLAGGIDEDGNWVGGSLTIVQLGDFIGRSYEDREVLDFILDVRERARLAGGTVHVLIGNHEVFGVRTELRWVHRDAFAAFEGMSDLHLDSDYIEHVPIEARARSAALMPGGLYARRLAEFPAVLRLGETIFAHGGVTPHWAEYGIERINEEVNRWFAGEISEPPSARGMDPGNFDDSVMMSRHFSDDVDDDDCAMLSESLDLLRAKRMIVAHTVQDSISSHCDGRVWVVDVGMSRYYGGVIQVLEILDDETVSVISQ